MTNQLFEVRTYKRQVELPGNCVKSTTTLQIRMLYTVEVVNGIPQLRVVENPVWQAVPQEVDYVK